MTRKPETFFESALAPSSLRPVRANWGIDCAAAALGGSTGRVCTLRRQPTGRRVHGVGRARAGRADRDAGAGRDVGRRAAAAHPRGRPEAFGALYLRHVAAARVLARQLARDPSEADELVAESFTRVLGVLQRGAGPEAALRPYLLSTMRRLHVDRRVAERKTEPTDDLTPHDQGEPFVDLPADELERSIVSTAFASLPERWRLVLWHTEVEGLPPAQVAPLLGISANATAALAVRARAGLRDAYLSAHVSDADRPGLPRGRASPRAATSAARCRGASGSRSTRTWTPAPAAAPRCWSCPTPRRRCAASSARSSWAPPCSATATACSASARTPSPRPRCCTPAARPRCTALPVARPVRRAARSGRRRVGGSVRRRRGRGARPRRPADLAAGRRGRPGRRRRDRRRAGVRPDRRHAQHATARRPPGRPDGAAASATSSRDASPTPSPSSGRATSPSPTTGPAPQAGPAANGHPDQPAARPPARAPGAAAGARSRSRRSGDLVRGPRQRAALTTNNPNPPRSRRPWPSPCHRASPCRPSPRPRCRAATSATCRAPARGAQPAVRAGRDVQPGGGPAGTRRRLACAATTPAPAAPRCRAGGGPGHPRRARQHRADRDGRRLVGDDHLAQGPAARR